jgi:phosphate:Na+ symporter
MVVIINIFGAAALLLWGLRMVGTGMERSFGAGLRQWINHGTDNRLKALMSGLLVTLALQSSTATCLMTASFVGRGLMESAVAQSVMLGANIGTGLVAKALTFDVGPLATLLILVGVAVFRSGEGRRRRVARIAIGLGLMLLALHFLDSATEPLRDSAQLRRVLHDLDGAWAVGLIAAAAMAMLAHSSVASILLILPLAAKGAFSLPFGLALILGANLGSAIPPVLETAKEKASARRVPLGNLLVRAAGCALVLPWLPEIAARLAPLGDDHAALLVNAHLGFNLALAVVFLPLAGPMAALLARLRPDEPEADDPGRPRYLDDSALGTPSVAISAAARETLRVADLVERMLVSAMTALRDGETRLLAEIGRQDDVVDSLHEAIKLYLARLAAEDLVEDERRRAGEIMTFAINLEHMGDIVDRNLKELAEKKIRQNLSFSPEGQADIVAMFALTLENLKMGTGLFMSGDARLARRLITDKSELRARERDATESHLARIRDGRRESIETSALHLDILRDLKRINAHIVSVAYPILERRGELAKTRLRPPPAGRNGPILT